LPEFDADLYAGATNWKQSMREPVVFRNPIRWLVAVIYIVAAVLAVSAALRSGSLTKMIFLVATAVACAILAVRAARSGICISDAGVIGRADRYTRRLRWDEIERFELRPRRFGGLWPRQGLGAWKQNGKWVRLMDYGLGHENEYGAALQVLQDRLSTEVGDEAASRPD
jgi:hypothetical protein